MRIWTPIAAACLTAFAVPAAAQNEAVADANAAAAANTLDPAETNAAADPANGLVADPAAPMPVTEPVADDTRRRRDDGAFPWGLLGLLGLAGLLGRGRRRDDTIDRRDTDAR